MDIQDNYDGIYRSQVQGTRRTRRRIDLHRNKCEMPRALLLKTKSSPVDPYDTAFREKTPLVPVFIPVLVHQRVNESQLRDVLQNDPRKQYIAFIITSQRVVEALSDAMACLTGISLL
jgi:hypothetical protein